MSEETIMSHPVVPEETTSSVTSEKQIMEAALIKPLNTLTNMLEMIASLSNASINSQSTINEAGKSPNQHSIEDITAKILSCKSNIVHSFIEIGWLLIEAKEQLKQFGNELWLDWLGTRVDFTERTAERYMKLARECSHSTALSDLGMTKALALLSLPSEQLDDFITKPHEIYGIEKSISEMTTREVEQVIQLHKGTQKKSPATKSKKKYTFNPSSKKDRKKHHATKAKLGTPPEPEYDIKSKIESMQACVEGLMNYLLEDDNEDDYYKYSPDLATLCESVLPHIPEDYSIQMCIERVADYLEYYYEDDDDYNKDELRELRDKLLVNIPLTEVTKP